MEIGGVVTTILIGALIGVLGRLVLPGRQPIGFVFTVLIGVGAAFAGSWIAEQFDLDRGPGIDWMELGIQVAVAAVGAGIVAAMLPEPRRKRRDRQGRSRSKR